ncbi:MAG: hypothetical protein RL258_1260 [Pseudomonadota bacterium]
MKLTNLLEHPALNQLRLSMGADSLTAPPVGWQPRLLDAEEVMRLGQPDPSAATPLGEGTAPSAQRVKGPRAVPVRYSRDRASSKILNPIGLPKGAIAVDVLDSPPMRAATPTIVTHAPQPQLPITSPSAHSPAITEANAAQEAPSGRSAPADKSDSSDSRERRRHKNQSALAALRRLEGEAP